MAELSWEEVVGGTKPAKQEKAPAREVSWEEATGAKPEPKLNRVTREAVNVADLVLSTPAFVAGVAADASNRLLGALDNVYRTFEKNPWTTPKSEPYLPDRRAERRRENARQGLRASETALEIGGNPLARIITKVSPERGAELADSSVARGMEWLAGKVESGGEKAEAGTGGGLLKEDIQSLANVGMLAVPKVVGKMLPKRTAQGSIEIPEAVAPVESGPAKIQLPPERASLRDLAQHYQQTIDNVKTSAAERKRRAADIRAAFAEGRAEAGETLKQQQFRMEESQRQSERWAQEEAAREAQENAARSYETQAQEAPDLTSSDLLRIMQKPAFERTAEDLVTLREARNRAMAVGVGAAGLAALADDAEDAGAAAAAIGLVGSSGGFRGPRGQIGAVKLPGGMWHPEAVERLSAPFKKPDMTPAGYELPEVKVQNAWADRAVRNWLNRQAGTAGDPLKDVQVPYGEGTISLEKLTDAMIVSQPAEVWQAPFDARRGGKRLAQERRTMQELTARARPEDPVHELSVLGVPEGGQLGAGLGEGRAFNAFKSYLSHVGDYLRQNVPPEKLQQYDLVRAVRETALNDERVAKQMAKDAADASAGLPTYTEYADGFRWVELKLPEKLTPEQSRLVAQDSGGWVALDKPDGKIIRNNYTQENARGATPEEAYLAGQLAREGNTMGHCVGGYCEGVAGGESRIFSLRDPKGQSHVTVEVGPETKATRQKWIEQPEEMNWGDWLKKNKDVEGQDILQIKGKQNRAPNEAYLPYVQDFVRGGKWGEVGDLSNTKLNYYGPAESSVTKGLVKEGYYTLEEYAKLENKETISSSVQRVPPGQRGGIDPELLKTVAAIGGGAALLAYLNDEDPAQGAMQGAVAGLVGRHLPWRKIGSAAETGLGIVSTRLGNISPALKQKMRQFELLNKQRGYGYKELGDPFFIQLNKLPKPQQREIKQALLTGDVREMGQVIERASPELAREWGKVQQVIESVGGELEAIGAIKRQTGYFPRVVADLPGLLEALGSKTKLGLEKELASAEKKAIDARGEGLSDIERSQIVNQFLLTPLRGEGRPGWSRSRRVQEVTDKLEPFYLDPTASFHAYVQRAALDIEKARLFGKEAAYTQHGGLKHLNTQKSIGNVMDKEIQAGRMTPEQAAEARGLLRSRFEGGERQAGTLVQQWKNLANIGMLGQLTSAVTQFGDVATSVVNQGLGPTLEGVAKVVTRRNDLRLKDFGLADHISEEFATTSKTAKAVNAVFKASLFSGIDTFGKTVALESARANFEKMARTPKGLEQLAKKYEAGFGEDFPQLVKDLQARKLTPTTRLLYFSELSDMQPISKLEVPQAYLNNPNGRLLYTFRTFMLKQLDLARVRGWDEMKKGNVKEGTQYLAKLGLGLGIAGATTDMIKDWMLGKDFDPRWEDIPMNALRTFGWSQYVLDKARDGKLKDVALSTIAPPMQMFDDLARMDWKTIQLLPVVGRLLYAHSEEGEADLKKKTEKEEARRIERELKPWFGKASEETKAEIRERKKQLREDRR